jgi:peroxiredoxin
MVHMLIKDNFFFSLRAYISPKFFKIQDLWPIISISFSPFCTFAKIFPGMLNQRAFYFILPFILFSCTDPDLKPNVRVSGIFPGFAGQFVYLEELEPMQAVMMDSSRVNPDGTIEFKLAVADAGFYILRTSKDNSLLLLLEKDEKVFINTTEKQLNPDLVIKGSPGSSQILEFEKFMRFQRSRIDSLALIYNSKRGEEDFFTLKRELDSLYLTYVEDQREYVFKFIDDHPGSLACLIVINRRLGQTEVISEMDDFMHLYRIDSLLQQQYPGNKHVLDHHERVKEIRGRIFDTYTIEEKLQPGRRAPDVVLNDTSGHPVSLKSFTGKKVILYFWAGWNAKSRLDNRKLIKLYPELHLGNTEVIGISLDENEIVWKGAIRLDVISWVQLSDLKGFYSDVKRAYNIPDELPFYYLIDEDQKIRFKHAELDSILVQLNR